MHQLTHLLRGTILTTLMCVLGGCGGGGGGGDSTDDSSGSETNTDVSSTSTDSGTDTDTNSNADTDPGAWMLNTTDERSSHIFEENSNQGVPVNVQSVGESTLDGKNYVRVEASGIPNYSVTITQALLDSLNERPNATTDFASGTPNINLGDVVAFGQDIGYNSNSRGNCLDTGGYGYWPPGPDCPQDTGKVGLFPQSPAANIETCDTGLGPIGYFINGTSIYDWNDGQSYNNTDVWHNTAANAEVHDLDICSGHAAQSDYHHHNWSTCLAEQIGDEGDGHSPVYGYAADGYPVHGPWFARDVLVKSAWRARDYADPNSDSGCGEAYARSCLLVDQYDLSRGTTPATSDGPDSNGTITSQSGNPIDAVSGLYFEDYYYDSSLTALGDEYLDEHNGHDHDGLGYHYHLTLTEGSDGDLTPAFPFTFGPTFYGELDTNTVTQCGGFGP